MNKEKPKLEDIDSKIYKIKNAKYNIEYNPDENVSKYEIDFKLLKKKDRGFNWYTRFEKHAYAQFISASINNEDVTTTYDTKEDSDGNLEEIMIDVPGSDETGEIISLTIRYKRKASRLVVDKAYNAKRIIAGFFCAFSAECERLEMDIHYSGGSTKVNSVMTPASIQEQNSETIVTKENLAPKQFTPVTVLLDSGNYGLFRHTDKAVWSVVSALLAYLLSLI